MSSNGYTRQSAGTIITGAVILASGLNAEYNQLVSAFDSSTGHDHSGGAGLSQPIPLATSVTGTLSAANGGTGVANNSASTITITGSYALGLTLSASTSLTLPTTGTLATLAGSETLSNKTLVAPALGTPASGNLANCTFPTLNQNTSGSAGSVAAANLTGSTLASGVTASSLTSFGSNIALGTPASGTLTNCTLPASQLTGTTLASGITTSSITNFGGSSSGTWNFVNSSSGGTDLLKILNNNTATSTASTFQAATGTANSFINVTQTDGATPLSSISIGSGVTGGLIIDGSLATSSGVTIKSGSGGTFLRPNGGTAYTISSVSGGALYSVTYNNGTSAAATYAVNQVQTITSNSSMNMLVNDNNGSPYAQFVAGTAITDINIINQASGGSVSITPGSGANAQVILTNGTFFVNGGSETTVPLALFTATGANGATIRLTGDGVTTPSKTLVVTGGNFLIRNNANAATIFQLSDAGAITQSTWNATKIGQAYGGTNIDTSASTGIAQVSSGTWSVATSLPSTTTATTQSASDNSTKVATTAYVDAATKLPLAVRGTLSGTNQVYTVDFTTYSAYELIIDGVLDVTGNAVNVTVDVSTDGGSTYKTATRLPNSTFEITVGPSIGMYLAGTISQPTTSASSQFNFNGASSSGTIYTGVTTYNSAAAINRVKISLASSTFAAGAVTLQPKALR